MWDRCLGCQTRLHCLGCQTRLQKARYRLDGYCRRCVHARAPRWRPDPGAVIRVAIADEWRRQRIGVSMKAPNGTRCAHCTNDDPRLIEDDTKFWMCLRCGHRTAKWPEP